MTSSYLRSCLRLLAALLLAAASASAQIVDYPPSGGSTADPLSLANITGTTSNCGGAAAGAASSVCMSANTITGEGATADGFETFVAFGDATADATLTISASAGGRITLSATQLAIGATPSYFGLAPQTNWLNTYGVMFDPGGGKSGLKAAAAGIVTVVSTDGSAGGHLQIGASLLTSATMTAESTAALTRDVTSSFTWSNAQVVALGAVLEGDITVATLPAKTQVLDALVAITGTAAGTTTLTVSCGDAIGGTPFTNLVLPGDAKAAVNTVYGDALAERGTSIDTEFWYLPSYTATTLVTCHYIATGANLSAVTGSTGRVVLVTRLLP